jgi:hypothetical protein
MLEVRITAWSAGTLTELIGLPRSHVVADPKLHWMFHQERLIGGVVGLQTGEFVWVEADEYEARRTAGRRSRRHLRLVEEPTPSIDS